MARAGGVALHFAAEELPLLPGALGYARLGESPGGTARNLDAFGQHVALTGADGPTQALFFDPQTSGGLLVALSASDADGFAAALENLGVAAVRVGRVEEGAGVTLHGRCSAG
jgi:selenide,water dikinase